jgi:very-short-patch-repair endonuclease
LNRSTFLLFTKVEQEKAQTPKSLTSPLRGEVAAKPTERGLRHANPIPLAQPPHPLFNPNMHPKPDAIQFARQLRQADNDAEALMWLELKTKQLGGYKFVRHFPIGPYFADFLCRSERLVVEIDGSQHSESSHDERRDQFMAAEGYSIIRFWNTDVYRERDAVCETILAALQGRITELVIADFKFIPRQNEQKSPLRRLRRHLSPEGRG